MSLSRAFSYGAGEAVARGLNWLVIAALPLVLSTEAYGVVGLLVAMERVGSGVLILGQDRSILRFYANSAHRGTLLWTVLLLACGAPLFVVLLCLVVLATAGQISIVGVRLVPEGLLLALIVAGYNAYRVYLSVLRAEDAVRGYVLARWVYQGVKVVAVVGIAYALSSGISYLLGTLVALGAAAVMGWRPLVRRIEVSVDRRLLKHIAAFGWPLVFHVLGGNIAGYVDRFMLGAYIDIEAVGVYTFAVALGSGVTFLYSALGTYFEPSIYRSAGCAADSERKLSVFFITALLLGAVAAAGVAFLFPHVVGIVGDGAYVPSASVVPYVMMGYIVQPVYLQANYRLVLKGKTRTLASGTVLSAVVNVVANMVLIPMHGIIGAALATFISYVVMSLFLHIASVSTYGMWRDITSINVVWVIVCASATVFAMLYSSGNGIFVVGCAAIALTSAAALYVRLSGVAFGGR